jgi:hypothetical protein
MKEVSDIAEQRARVRHFAQVRQFEALQACHGTGVGRPITVSETSMSGALANSLSRR